MSKMRWVNTDFWADTWVVDNLNPLDRYLFIYLFTNAHTNIAGVYELSLRIMSFETGIEREELLRMLQRLQPKVRYIDGWVVLRNGIKNQNYKNSKISAGILTALENVPSELLQHVKWPNDFGQPKPKGSNQTQIFDESSHSDSDIELDSDIDTELIYTAPQSDETNEIVQAVQKNDPISKLYYEAVKAIGLPTRNHDTLRKKIAEMKHEAPEEELIRYLEFMRDKYPIMKHLLDGLDDRPRVTEALDIHCKRLKIEEAFRSLAREHQQPRVWRPRFA